MSRTMAARISSLPMVVESLHSDPTLALERCNWNLLTPPPSHAARPLRGPFLDNDERNHIGIIKFHPSLNRIVYTAAITRSQYDSDKETCCQERRGDIGETRIIVHDFDVVDATTNFNTPMAINGVDGKTDDPKKIVASFTLHELNMQIDEFRNNQNRIMNVRERKLNNTTNSSSSPNRSGTRSKYTVQMLGEVQNIDFLCAEEMKYEDDDRLMNIHHLRLMIGFRQCVVVVSIDQSMKEAINDASTRGHIGGARWLKVIAYIGPDHHLENACSSENSHMNEKASKKLPSSFPVPISESILAYGCYDGGIRFYDILRQKTIKSCLGPNGRGNPIVKMLLANRMEPNNSSVALSALRKNHFRRSKNTTAVILRPRIISVSATGDAYLWELELSIDVANGGVCVLNIPPPLASMDGLVAAVSGSGMPVVYPTALTSSSISSLSPSSPWEQMDEINSQFEVSYDPHQDLFCWVFSPGCIASSLKPQASRDEQLNMNGVMVYWKLTELPLHSEWPPPAMPPYCVVQLPPTKYGRVSADMVAGPGFIWNHQFLTTFYITSSDELMVVKSDLKEKGESIHVASKVSMLADMKTSFSNHDKSGFDCFRVVATSNINRSLLAMGTQYGVLFAEIKRKKLPIPSEKEGPENIASRTSDRFSDLSFDHEWSFSEQRPTLLAERVNELECRNKELEFQLDEMMQEAHDHFSNKECGGLRSHLHDVLETELGTALETIERLENEARVKNQSCEALESQVKALEVQLDRVNQELVEECHDHKATMQKLASTEERMKIKEAEYSARESELVANVEAQELALESLVNLLELQRGKYENSNSAQNDDEIIALTQGSIVSKAT